VGERVVPLRPCRNAITLSEVRKREFARQFRRAPQAIEEHVLAAIIRPQPHNVALVGDDIVELGLPERFFFSPKQPVGGWILGAGPTVVVLREDSEWTYGLLANHLSSFAGTDHRGNVKFNFIKTGMFKGTGELYVNGKRVAAGPIDKTVPGSFSLSETFDVGVDNGTPVSNDYKAKDHFPFTGQIDKVTINLVPEGGNQAPEVDASSVID
jgi:hypothetical protein